MKRYSYQETEAVRTYKKLGMEEVTSEIQRENGSRSFYDPVTARMYVFTRYGAPRVEYWSNKSRKVNNWSLRKEDYPSREAEQMQMALPFILRGRDRAKNRALKSVVDAFSRL